MQHAPIFFFGGGRSGSVEKNRHGEPHRQEVFLNDTSLGQRATNMPKRCIVCRCKRANYSLPNSKTQQWCGWCRPNDAVNPYGHKCEDCGQKWPTFGPPGGKKRWCGACKPDNAVRLSGMCEDCGQKQATFGLPGGKKQWCAGCGWRHGAEDVHNRRCEVCRLTTANGIHTVCASCDTTGSRRSRVREKQVAKWLVDAGVQWTSWDKQLPESACGRYRPDFTFECAGHVVVLEVDELEHAQPGYECDNRRMLDVFNAYGGTPVVFLRYNPDTPTFGDKKRKFNAQRRKQVLLSELRAALAQPPQHALSIVRLFYSDTASDSTGNVCASFKRVSHVDPYDASFTENM